MAALRNVVGEVYPDGKATSPSAPAPYSARFLWDRSPTCPSRLLDRVETRPTNISKITKPALPLRTQQPGGTSRLRDMAAASLSEPTPSIASTPGPRRARPRLNPREKGSAATKPALIWPD